MDIPDGAIVHIRCHKCGKEETLTWGEYFNKQPKVGSFIQNITLQCKCGNVAEVWAADE